MPSARVYLQHSRAPLSLDQATKSADLGTMGANASYKLSKHHIYGMRQARCGPLAGGSSSTISEKPSPISCGREALACPIGRQHVQLVEGHGCRRAQDAGGAPDHGIVAAPSSQVSNGVVQGQCR